MKTKIKNSISFLLIAILSLFSACYKQEELTLDEQWYVGKWGLSRIVYDSRPHSICHLVYPAQGNGVRIALFNEIGSEYWGQTSFVFLEDKINGQIDGYLQIGENITNFKWNNAGSKNRDTSMEFSTSFYFNMLDGNGKKTRKEAVFLTDSNPDKLIVGNFMGGGLMVYIFTRVEEEV